MSHNCAYCRQPIGAGVYPFTLRLELFHAIEPGLQISQQDLDQDFETEMERLIEIMDSMSDQQVVEQEKRLFVSYSFTLCPACRDRLAVQLERLKPPSS